MITYTNTAVTLQVSSTDLTQHLISTIVTPDDGSSRAETYVGYFNYDKRLIYAFIYGFCIFR
jgi:hypothetical protein